MPSFTDALEGFALSPNHKAEARSLCAQGMGKDDRKVRLEAHINPSLTLNAIAHGSYDKDAAPHYLGDTLQALRKDILHICVLGVGPIRVREINEVSLMATAHYLSAQPRVGNCPFLVLTAVSDYFWREKKDTPAYSCYLDAVNEAVLELFTPSLSWLMEDVREEVVTHLKRKKSLN